MFTKEVNKIGWLATYDKKGVKLLHLLKRYEYGTSKDLVSKKKKIKTINRRNNITKQL